MSPHQIGTLIALPSTARIHSMQEKKNYDWFVIDESTVSKMGFFNYPKAAKWSLIIDANSFWNINFLRNWQIKSRRNLISCPDVVMQPAPHSFYDPTRKSHKNYLFRKKKPINNGQNEITSISQWNFFIWFFVAFAEPHVMGECAEHKLYRRRLRKMKKKKSKISNDRHWKIWITNLIFLLYFSMCVLCANYVLQIAGLSWRIAPFVRIRNETKRHEN